MAVDLRGHGRSDNAEVEGNYAMEVFADDLAWLCEQLSQCASYQLSATDKKLIAEG